MSKVRMLSTECHIGTTKAQGVQRYHARPIRRLLQLFLKTQPFKRLFRSVMLQETIDRVVFRVVDLPSLILSRVAELVIRRAYVISRFCPQSLRNSFTAFRGFDRFLSCRRAIGGDVLGTESGVFVARAHSFGNTVSFQRRRIKIER